LTLRFLPAGDRGLVVEFGDTVDRGLSGAVLQLQSALRAAALPGVVETVPTFRSLMVYFDPLATGRAALEAAIEGLAERPAEAAATATLWHLPACYEPEFAPDLAEVAERTRLKPAEVVELHASTRFHVYMIGFLPGFPYLGDLPPQLALPRRADPRVRVPAGSIAIATGLSAIYPHESPGGWHLIAATPVRLFDAAQARPALLAPGDAVAFEPIAAAEFAAIKAAVAAGRYRVASETIAA
jgi:inhibitor of KinA